MVFFFFDTVDFFSSITSFLLFSSSGSFISFFFIDSRSEGYYPAGRGDLPFRGEGHWEDDLDEDGVASSVDDDNDPSIGDEDPNVP